MVYFRISGTTDGDIGARHRLREALCIHPSQTAPNQGFGFIESWYEDIQTARGQCADFISVSYYCMVKSFEIQEHMQEYET